MKSLAIDTNALIDLLENGHEPPKSFSSYDELLVSATVIGEFRAGLQDTKRGESMLWKLRSFLDKASVRAVPLGEKTAEIYAKVFQTLRAAGKPIPQNDIWIAASALEHGAALATTDAHFRFVPLLTAIPSRDNSA